MIGRMLSHYRIVAPLGEGGSATVYRAEDTRLGRTVALKVPHPSMLGGAGARERFLREARITSALDHPNIVVLYEVGAHDDVVYLAMQHVEGEALRARLGRGPLAAAEAAAVARAVADALAHAHARGVVHRDVKPENVLLAADGRVKVADFGIARLAADATATAEGTILGTFAYLAPEVVQGGRADARSDLYGLGLTLWEMLAGHPPFQAADAAALLYAIVHAAPAPLPSSVPASLVRCVEALLARDPARRPATAEQVATMLAAAPAAGAPEMMPGRSTAVLAFRNLTGNPEDEAFAAGIGEDLVTDLLKLPDLRVASRSSVEALGAVRAVDAGRALGVATVLEGSVRRAGPRVRVTAQLVSTDTGFPVWAERYDRSLEDIFEVQEDIARAIAEALRVTLAPEGAERPGRRTSNVQAFERRAQALVEMRRFEPAANLRAIALLEEALRADPHYAVARAELAECCTQMYCKAWDTDPAWLDRAEREAQTALTHAPELPDALRALGHIEVHRRRPERAIQYMERAIELDPRLAGALLTLANVYLFTGDRARAEVLARRARSIDPSDARTHLILGEAVLQLGRFDETITVVEEGLRTDVSPIHRGRGYELLMMAHAARGDAAGMNAVVAQVDATLPAGSLHARLLRATARAWAGDTAAARAGIAGADLTGVSNIVRVAYARVLAQLGELPQALAVLESAQAIDVLGTEEMAIDPFLAPLRGNPQFERLVTAQRLPELS